MTKQTHIAQLGDEVLRREAQVIDDFSEPKFHELIETMHGMMLEANGVGIAAPQLGESLQIVIIACRPTARYPLAPVMPPIVMVNPSFTLIDAELHKDWEGCLSVPGVRALVPRYRAIKVSYQDQQGYRQDIALEDFPARVFQHEFDHLQGLVYLDRVEYNRDIIAESEFFKLIAVEEHRQ
jgi:peptide deformylase